MQRQKQYKAVLFSAPASWRLLLLRHTKFAASSRILHIRA